MVTLSRAEHDLLSQIEEIGFALHKYVPRRSGDFIYYKRDDGAQVQVNRKTLDKDFVDMVLRQFAPKKKTPKRRKKSKSKNSLTTKKNDDILVDKSLEPESGVVLEPNEAKRIDEEYIKTHWS